MQALRLYPLALLVFALAVCVPCGQAAGDELPTAKPESVGMSTEALTKIDAVVDTSIQKKEVAGAVTVVARKGKIVYFRAAGAFKKDSIVRIYSMSKPVTVAAALILVDEGKLKLDDPVASYLPAFANLKVHGKETKAAPMTVRHLMQHTAGLSYGFFGNTPVDRAYRSAGVLDRSSSLAAMTKKLGQLALLTEPGTRWHYSLSLDVLGRVIEVIAKQPFETFLKKRLFDPLGMRDTAFCVPQAKAARLVANYAPGQFVIDTPATSQFLAQPGLCSGGGGLVSTARDYTIFALMLAQGGTWNGTRILKAATVRQMTTNSLPKALIPIRMGRKPLLGLGFGLGVSVRVSHADARASLGEWAWSGAASTTFFVAPTEELVVVNLIQRMPYWSGLDLAIRPLVYGAVSKPALAGSPR
jgi:CubicO group peptidase (beta-lactamase class C family)